jgi:hypothetical protein
MSYISRGDREKETTMKSATVSALLLLCLACGPTPPPPDAREFVPEAIPPGGPQPWERGTKRPTATRTATLTATPTATPTAKPAEAAPAPPASEKAPEISLTPAELKTRILELMRQGMDQDLIVTYVSRQRLASRLTVDDILAWKQAGIADEIIKAAAAQ